MSRELRLVTKGEYAGQTITVKLFSNDGLQQGADISTTEVGISFLGDVAVATPEDKYDVVFYDGADVISVGILYWDGDKEITLLNVSTGGGSDVSAITTAVNNEIDIRHGIGEYNRMGGGGGVSLVNIDKRLKIYFEELQEKIYNAPKNEVDFTEIIASISLVKDYIEDVKENMPKYDKAVETEILRKLQRTEQYIDKKEKKISFDKEKKQKKVTNIIQTIIKESDKKSSDKLKRILDRAILQDIIKKI